MPEFTIEHLKPGDLTPHPNNFRRHPDRQRKALAASIEEHGYLSAPIWNKRSGHVLDGHARVELAIAQSEDTIPVRVIDVPVDQERRILRVFDAVGGMAEEDSQALDRLIEEIGDVDLERLLGEITEPESGLLPEADPDAIPEAVQTRAKAGDLWLLGEHRLLCGDCTVATDVERLMQSETVPAVLTDPPYQMGKDLTGDNLEDDALYRLHADAFTVCPLQEAATVICFHATRTFPVALEAARYAGWKFERMLWLFKPNDCTFPWRGWILKSESILVFSQGGGHWNEVHPFHHDTYEFNHHGGELAEGVGHHPTVKPCEVVTDILTRIAAKVEAVYDPFAGSGTTLIACEQTGRVARCIEIEPRYCDVIIARYEQATGKSARLA